VGFHAIISPAVRSIEHLNTHFKKQLLLPLPYYKFYCPSSSLISQDFEETTAADE